MKDQETIKKLQMLKTMQPTKPTLKSIKGGVYQQVQGENKTQTYLGNQDKFRPVASLIKSYGFAFYAGASAFLLIIFLSVTALVLPNQTHDALLYGRLSLAPDQYQKARIALEDTKNRFADNIIAQTTTNELAYSLNMTNTQLSELKLKGEKGKYTAQECHQIYQEYLTYLETKEKIIPSNKATLKSQFDSYEEQAERKLHMYKSL